MPAAQLEFRTCRAVWQMNDRVGGAVSLDGWASGSRVGLRRQLLLVRAAGVEPAQRLRTEGF